MQNLPFLPQSVSGAISLIFALAFAIYGAITKFQNNSGALRRQINEDYKERNTQLTENVKILQENLNKMGREISELRGQLTEKEKHVTSLTELVQGRNPEMIQVLNEIKEFMKQLHEGMQASNKELLHQTSMLEKKV